ncbi:MAG TPA: hypothetical protein VGC85_11890, partial [Chthoniobacterales bacterium]
YYVVGTPDRAASQQRTDELMKDIEQLRERMSDPAQAEELRKLIDNLQSQIKQLQGQLNQAAYENEQLKKKNDELAKKNDAQDEELKHHKPFAVLAWADDPALEVDLDLEDDMIPQGGDARLSKPFDPSQPYHTSPWTPDISGIALPNRGFTVWVSAYRVPKANIKVFVKPGGQSKLQKPSRFSTIAVGRFTDKRVMPMTEITLTPERPWDLLGTLIVGEEYEMIFKVATQEERDEEWRLRKLQPLPTPTPAEATATPMTREEMEDLRKRADRIRKQFEEQQKQRGSSPFEASPAPRESVPNESPNAGMHHTRARAPAEITPQPSATP